MKQSTTQRRGPAAGMRAAATALALVATTALPSSAQDLDQRERQRLFSQVKPAVVLIYSQVQADITIPRDDATALVLSTATSSAGSGWVITPDGFIVTNGHVVEMYHESNETELRQGLLYQALTDAGVFSQADPETGRLPTEQEAIQETLEIYQRADIVLKKDLVAVLQNGQTLEASVREYSPPVVALPGKTSIPGLGSFDNGRDVAILKVSGRDLPTMTIGDSDGAAIGEEIFVAGYPGAAALDAISDASTLEASFTRGQIASLKAAIGGEDLIQVDAAASPGSSGGPVFDRNGDVLGILTLGEGQNFNFAVTANTIRDFFRSSGGVAGESLFDRTWTRALDAYYSSDYDGAIEGFDEALRLMPNLPDAMNLRRMAMTAREDGAAEPPLMGDDPATPAVQQAAPQAADEGGLPGWLLGVMALGAVLLGAGLLMRRQPAAATAAVGAGAATRTSGAPAATVAMNTGAAHLRVSGGPLQGNRFEVGPDGVRIGRDPAACQIVLSEASVSREHAVVRRTGSGLSIKNLSGTNPTYVNDRAIQEASLASGDRVKIGDSIFEVEA
ncbi:trypsin-like peptidase domain-containing protein [Gemmatimonadota bacterium DH-20]|uniref:Trypsin-like peptidase domain-containing protein n=1 Tax=Gaopeijia maritima TaxID=3119007 RepID=A0ABU9E7U9_9BACT